MEQSLVYILSSHMFFLFAGLLIGPFMLGRDKAKQILLLNSQLEDLRNENISLREAKIEAEIQRDELSERDKALKDQFKASANQMILDLAKSSRETHCNELQSVLSPLKKSIEKFKEETDSFRASDISEKATLKQQIKALQEVSLGLGEKADGLSMVLRGDQRSQGVWGEIQLRVLLEKSGLKEGINFFEQGKGFKLRSEEGRVLRPDILIKMPTMNSEIPEMVIVDSKVSLVAYDRYSNTDCDIEKKKYLKEHVQAVRAHISNLASKEYETAEGILTVDYVMLFMGIESALILAMNNDPGLQDFAIENNVILVSQSMLLPALRSVAFLWRQHSQISNIKGIISEVEKMYLGFLRFNDSLAKVRQAYEKADESLLSAAKQLSVGKGNLTDRAKRIKQLSSEVGLIEDDAA